MQRLIVFTLFSGLFGAGMVARAGLGQTNPPNTADTATPQWEIDAGRTMTFDVASVKVNTSGKIAPAPSVPLDSSDFYPGRTTLFSVDASLTTFIGFAFKLMPSERLTVESQLPKWATTERFAIQARSATPGTKDQMRLMMQSLLADRFKLAIHFETEEKPVFALVLVKPGKPGPQLRLYADDPPCAATTHVDQIPRQLVLTAGYFPPMCGPVMSLRRYENGANLITWGSRDVSIQQLADDMAVAPTANLGRPVVDKTGLNGNFDFVMSFGEPTPLPPGGGEPVDSGPTFLEALKDQLGLKLDSTTAAVENPVIDHIEEPSEN